jgi:hypothetical protein
VIPQKRIQRLNHHAGDGRIVSGCISLDSFSQSAGDLDFEFFGRIGTLVGGGFVFHQKSSVIEILRPNRNEHILSAGFVQGFPRAQEINPLKRLSARHKGIFMDSYCLILQ